MSRAFQLIEHFKHTGQIKDTVSLSVFSLQLPYLPTTFTLLICGGSPPLPLEAGVQPSPKDQYLWLGLANCSDGVYYYNIE